MPKPFCTVVGVISDLSGRVIWSPRFRMTFWIVSTVAIVRPGATTTVMPPAFSDSIDGYVAARYLRLASHVIAETREYGVSMKNVYGAALTSSRDTLDWPFC